jgi:hypothetical protein
MTAARRSRILLVAAIASALLSLIVFAVTFVDRDQSRGVWTTQALFGSASLIVLAANLLFWRWRGAWGHRETGAEAVGLFAALAALSLVAVVIVFGLISSTIYTEPWSAIP